MYYVEVDDRTHSGTSRHATEDKWDCDDTYTEHSIQGIKVVGERDSYDLNVEFDPREQDSSYLLYAIYDTGCSFCRQEGEIEFIGLFSTLETANKNKASLEAHEKLIYERGRLRTEKQIKAFDKAHPSTNFVASLTLDDGTEYDISIPWHGYFESLQYIDVESVLCE